MNDSLAYICDRLMQKDCTSLSAGLRGGKTGICLFLALYLKKKNSYKVKKQVSVLFSNILKEVPGLSCSLFEGMLGVGWMIRYLSNKSVLSIKEEIQYIYTSIANYYMGNATSSPFLFSPEDRFFSIGVYMLQLRVEANSSSCHIVDELFIRLIDECERLMKSDVKNLYSYKNMQLSMLHSLLYFLLRMDAIKLYPLQTSKLIEYSSLLYRQLQKQSPADDFIFRFLSNGSADLPIIDENDLSYFMGEIGFYSMLYELPQLFTSAYQQYCDKFSNGKQRIKNHISNDTCSISTLCGLGYGLLEL